MKTIADMIGLIVSLVLAVYLILHILAYPFDPRSVAQMTSGLLVLCVAETILLRIILNRKAKEIENGSN